MYICTYCHIIHSKILRSAHSVWFMVATDLRTNSFYLPRKHQPTGFCNTGGVCSLRGTSCNFIYNSV